MTTFQTRTLSTLSGAFGGDTFTRFEAATAMDTTEGNLRFTLNRLVKSGAITEVSALTYKVV
jgi:hypothetical protein